MRTKNDVCAEPLERKSLAEISGVRVANPSDVRRK